MQRKPWFMIAVIFLILVPLEAVAAFVAYYTMGEVMRAFHFLLIGANLGFIALCAAKPKVGVTLALLWGLVMVSNQGILAARLWRAQREAERVITWAYDVRLTDGAFPADLDSYMPEDEAIMPHLHWYEHDEPGEDFWLAWSPLAEPSSGNSYSPSAGWLFSDD